MTLVALVELVELAELVVQDEPTEQEYLSLLVLKHEKLQGNLQTRIKLFNFADRMRFSSFMGRVVHARQRVRRFRCEPKLKYQITININLIQINLCG